MEENKSEPIVKCRCIVCNGTTNHKVLKEVKRYYDDETGWWDESIFQIIQCAGCEKTTFREMNTDVTCFSTELDGHYYNIELYPKRNANTRNIKPTKNLPHNLKTIYRETIDTFNNGQYILCTAGLKTVIEGICLDKKIPGKEIVTKTGIKRLSTSLESKIDGLSINRFLTDDNCVALHELRFLGNEALHELSPPAVNDLNIGIDIIELTLTNIYELGHKTKILRTATAKPK